MPREAKRLELRGHPEAKRSRCPPDFFSQTLKLSIPQTFPYFLPNMSTHSIAEERMQEWTNFKIDSMHYYHGDRNAENRLTSAIL
jgi:hypothetical protein